MATDFNNNAISTGGGIKPSTKDTPTRIGERIETLSDITSVPNPWIGMIIYVLDTGKRYEVLSLKEVQQGLSKVSRVDQYKEVVDKEYVDDAIANAQLSGGNGGSVNLEGYAKTEDIPTKLSELENDSNFLTSVPSEYITETELNNKKYATQDFVTNEIAKAQLEGGDGDVNLDGFVEEDDVYAIVDEYTDGKKQRYVTQEEYDLMSDAERNSTDIVWNIIDDVNQNVPQDLTLDASNKLQLKDADGNAMGTGVTLNLGLPVASASTLGGIKVGEGLDINSDGVLNISSQSAIGTANEVILVSPSGYKFKLVVSDSGQLSTEAYIEYGRIVLSTSNLTINEGTTSTFDVKLDRAPTNNQIVSISSSHDVISVQPSQLTFNSTNYDTTQTVTINPTLDGIYENYNALLTLSSDNVEDKTISLNIVNTEERPTIPCEAIGLSATILNLMEGKSDTITTMLTPPDTTDEVIWSASNENCTVVNGVVTAVKEGECVITATCGQRQASCTVTIADNPDLGRSYVDDDSLVMDFNFKNLEATTNAIYDSKQNAKLTPANNTNGERCTANGLLMNGNVQGNAKDAEWIKVFQAMDNYTTGITYEFFGNTFPQKIFQLYASGGIIESGTTSGYESGIALVSKYYDSTDTIKENKTGLCRYVSDPNGGADIYISAGAGQQTIGIDKYSHVIVELYPDGTCKMFINGYEAKRANEETVVDFKEYNFSKQVDSAYWVYTCQTTLGADTTKYASSMRIYNRLLTAEEKQNNLQYELASCGLN